MSFLDSLENNLKSLESQQEGRTDVERQQLERERNRAKAQATAPYAEELKKGPDTAELLKQAARLGHSMRLKVHIAWLGSTLRLEARGRRLELRPAPDGVAAVWLEENRETRTDRVDLGGNPETLLREWLSAG